MWIVANLNSIQTDISISAPNRPTAYTLRWVPAPYLFVACAQRLGIGVGLPQWESLELRRVILTARLPSLIELFRHSPLVIELHGRMCGQAQTRDDIRPGQRNLR